jgi:hypothetical protein
MNKIIALAIVISLLGFGWWYVYTQQPGGNVNIVSTKNGLTSPERVAEINGYVMSVEGNEVIIANEVGVKQISDEERARRQKLSQEERQALKAAESANLQKENMTVTIPVGTIVVKGTGDASGNNLKAEMVEIKKGAYLSVWKNGENVEFVKIKGI